MDALSNVLKSVRLEGAMFLDAEFTAPWCILGRYGLSRVRKRLPAAEHVMFFHFLLEGRCKVRLAGGGEVLDVQAGDVVLFPGDDRHIMGSDLKMNPMDTEAAAARSDPDFKVMRLGGGGTATRFVCSYLACSRGVSRLLFDALPRIVRIPLGEGPASVPLRELLKVAVLESADARPGAQSMLAKLSELLFVEALRRYAESLPPAGKGWLAAVRDPQIGRALASLHREPSKAWTVDSLAREVALSRSALAERFADLVGDPPMQYLTRWRLALAAQALRASNEALVRIAERSGYESEAAFSRAFKREFGVPPAAWRKSAPSA